MTRHRLKGFLFFLAFLAIAADPLPFLQAHPPYATPASSGCCSTDVPVLEAENVSGETAATTPAVKEYLPARIVAPGTVDASREVLPDSEPRFSGIGLRAVADRSPPASPIS